MIRERVIPRAVLYFTGEAVDDEYDEDDEDEEDDDEDRVSSKPVILSLFISPFFRHSNLNFPRPALT